MRGEYSATSEFDEKLVPVLFSKTALSESKDVTLVRRCMTGCHEATTTKIKEGDPRFVCVGEGGDQGNIVRDIRRSISFEILSACQVWRS